jgi:two-component system response regulator HydG
MAAPLVFILSRDPALVLTIRSIVAELGNLSVQAEETLGSVRTRLRGQEQVALFILHLTKEDALKAAAAFLEALAAAKRPVATLIVSDHYRPEEALRLLRLGAAEYLARPLDLPRLAFLIDVLTARARVTARLSAPSPLPTGDCRLPIELKALGTENPFLFDGAAGMDDLMEQVVRVAPQESTLLLTGATGTGKTRLARLIHELSPRRTEPFVVVQCGSLSANLIESELFGHVRGAFTGADRDRAGKFAEAGRGTLLLDEIDALAPAQQGKILRAVEDRVFEPVGANQTMPLPARLIAASNRALDVEVAAGSFREDLYYRLNVVGFYLPPLRERSSVIPSLARHFLAEFARRNARRVHGIAAEALHALQSHDWPGNVRELRNVVERAVALCPGTDIQLGDLPEPLRSVRLRVEPGGSPAGACPLRPGSQTEFGNQAQGTLAKTKEDAEAARITAALARNQNNRRRAAAELGISRMTLYKKLYRYGLIARS